ncbi:MAG: protein translocase subunit SecDF [Paludibacter sp.]|nr:protein translocase subunit SecDF [Bacteroidales bacterium]MCM1068487.1 protein translocase subunit SecDF [Prevotella sp.]MCM1353441.1 protein translocase subunit SecDF [Bacteroides sp.]MCM1442602.1 protein translocase subunit SecDF [Muribaculum sp.]MCM1481447.1 protein translocase subunit SecDF [Paludibacter sp.]
MQNKGLVRILAVCLTLVCAFYLSFSIVTSHYNKKAVEYAQGDKAREYQYLDSVASKKVYFGYTLKQCREKEINLGLDLKGGMNVTMEVSVPDILKALSGYNTSENFTKAMALAQEKQKNSTGDFVTLFIQSYKEIDPNAQLASVFSTFELKDKVTLNSTNDEVEKVIREEVDGAINNSFNVLRTRIDRFGVVQPNIQKLDQAGRILIELPGIKEPERVRKLLQGTANLEFWETYDFGEILPQMMQLNQAIAQINATNEAVAEEDTIDETDDTTVSELDSLLQTAQTDEADQKEALEAYTKQNPLFAVLNPSVNQAGQAYRGPVVGTVIYTDTAKVNSMLNSQLAKSILPRDLKLCWTVKAIDEAGAYYQLVALKTVNRDGRASLEGDVITDARADFSQTSAYANVSMSMNAEGAKTWARITKENIGKSIAIVLDGYVYSFPTVQNEITGGNSQITGNFTVEEAKDLANTLKSGKMPAPARIIQEDVVGPSLGQKAIHDGLISFIIAFCLVLLYMIFYYGFIPGLVADVALLCNVFLLFGILASFSAVLTLSGIAGIVLTMGMAVDANVLIYERIREEMAAGKNMKKAIQDGYSNAISAIIDANVTTFLTGVVLAVFGTGPIRGFAVTLMIGIISSFLTAVFVSRLLLERYAESKRAKELPFTTKLTKNWFRNTHIDFVGKRFWGYGISGVLIIFCILGLIPGALQSELNFGIDFSGGRNYIVRFAQPVNTEEIEASLDNVFKETLQTNETYSLTVITIGDNNQVRISTNYRIHENGEELDDQIEALLYEGCKPFLADNVTPEQFLSTQVDDTIGIMQSQKVGPSIADDIKVAAIWSILIALVIIALYIFIRFRNLSFSAGALVGLAHDTVIILGLYALLWKIMPFSMEIDQSFIAAILTIIGYSINDTVVVFDRIREYNTLYPKRDRRSKINEALNATLSRTFSTSMSTFVVLLAIFIFGGETIRGFIFALMLGVIIGTYSTLFIAVPISFDIQDAIARRKEKKAALKK